MDNWIDSWMGGGGSGPIINVLLHASTCVSKSFSTFKP